MPSCNLDREPHLFSLSMKPQTRTWHLTASTSLGFCSSVSTSQIEVPAMNLKPSGLLAGFYSMRNTEFHIGFGARKKRKLKKKKKIAEQEHLSGLGAHRAQG